MLYCILPINTLEATIFNKFIIIDIYRLDGVMMGLQDLHWTERSVSQCMF